VRAIRDPSPDAVQPAPRRAILVALAISLALHAVLLAELPAFTSMDEPVRTTLTAELQRPPPAPAPKAAIPPARKPSPPTARPVPTPAAEAPTFPLPRTDQSVAPPPLPEPVAETIPEPTSESPTIPDPVPAPAVAETLPVPPEPMPVTASSGTVTYELFYRGSGGSIGRSIQTWRIDRTGYRLTSLTEPTGLAALFLSHVFDYTSEGRIGPDGLQPERFTARSGRRGSRQSAAIFDWPNKEITFGAAGTAQKQTLPAGTQDLLSFVYQIALAPELTPGKRQMVITSGAKVDTYVLDIGQEEAIDLPIGPMRAIPIRRITAPGEEGMQLWLSSIPPRLPVRIRFLDREGKMTIEQLAARIEFHGS